MAKAVPPSLIKALERWDKQGSEARFETDGRLESGLRGYSARPCGNHERAVFWVKPWDQRRWRLKPGAVDKVLGVLAELGYLGEIRGDVE